MYIMYTGALISADGTYTGSVTGFSPIGTQNKPFKGTFDGDNYTIRGVYVTNAPNAGLFGYVNSATIVPRGGNSLDRLQRRYSLGLDGVCLYRRLGRHLEPQHARL